MVDFMLLAAPTSGLFLVIVLFLGLMFKIATQNVSFKQRSRKYLTNKFFFCLALTLLFLPFITVIATSDLLVSNFVFRMLPVLIGAFAALGCAHAFLDVLRFYPKDEPKTAKEDELPRSAESPS